MVSAGSVKRPIFDDDRAESAGRGGRASSRDRNIGAGAGAAAEAAAGVATDEPKGPPAVAEPDMGGAAATGLNGDGATVAGAGIGAGAAEAGATGFGAIEATEAIEAGAAAGAGGAGAIRTTGSGVDPSSETDSAPAGRGANCAVGWRIAPFVCGSNVVARGSNAGTVVEPGSEVTGLADLGTTGDTAPAPAPDNDRSSAVNMVDPDTIGVWATCSPVIHSRSASTPSSRGDCAEPCVEAVTCAEISSTGWVD